MEDVVSCCRRRFAVCMDFGQAQATIEAISSQTGDRVGNRDARQARAFIEAPFSQTGDGIGNRDARQARATQEAISSQTGDRVGNRDARQARAVTVFVNRIISITCTLNDRKVIA